MVHRENFVAVIQTVKGETLREFTNEDKTYIVKFPFGSEYQIYLKNLDCRRALVEIEVDGKNIQLDGHNGIIVNGNSSTVIEGFIKNNKTIGRFKFIQKTEKIVETRGDKPEDGIIRIKVSYEKPVYVNERTWWSCPTYYWWNPYITSMGANNSSDNISNISGSVTLRNNIRYTSDANNVSSNYLSALSSTKFSQENCSSLDNKPLPQEGITVMGSDSNQTFSNASFGEIENSFVITIKMIGSQENEKIQNPITVKTQSKCKICGTTNWFTNKYCTGCGTKLLTNITCE